MQATLIAEMTYYFVVDGYNGAYGVWQFSLEALDNSTVHGSLLSGPYGLAVAGTSSTNTSSKSAFPYRCCQGPMAWLLLALAAPPQPVCLHSHKDV